MRRGRTPALVTSQQGTAVDVYGGGVSGVATTARPSTWPLYCLISTVALGCYLNGLGGDFVHDDVPAVVKNKDVLGENPIGHVFKNDFWGTPMADRASHKSYRPLTILTFRANYLMFGLEPEWFHFTNLLMHIAACILFTKVCLDVAMLKPPFATLAGLLFAAHPIHTEAVTGIVGRADVLACVFFLVSLLAYHGDPDGRCHIWISVTLGGLSMLAKETGVSVFILNLAYDLYRHWPAVKKTIVEVRWNRETLQFANRAAKVFTSLGIFLAVRLALLQGSLPKFSQQDNPTAFHPSLYVRVLTFCYLAAFNWWLLLCPDTLSHDWQMGSVPLLTSLGDSRNLLTCFFFGIAILLAVRSLMDFDSQKHIPIVLGLMLLILPFLPAANLVVTVGFVVAERVLYIPSMGSILLVVYGIQMLCSSCGYKRRQTMLCLMTLLLITYCIRTVVRNRDWRSRESLLKAGLMTLPHNAKMHYNYANFLRQSECPELAKTYYNKALTLWPTYASAHNNLGTLLSSEEEAEQHFLSAIRYSADHVNAHFNLGQLYRRANRSIDSEQMLLRTIILDPGYKNAYIELARLRGPKDRSVGILLKKVAYITRKEPHYQCIYGHWLVGKGLHADALKNYWKALSVQPSHRVSMLGVSRVLRKQGQSSRLLQLITRWHSALRLERNETPLSPHVYLQGWHLKSELNLRARAYDNCTAFLYGSRCLETSVKPKNYSSEELTDKWTEEQQQQAGSSNETSSEPSSSSSSSKKSAQCSKKVQQQQKLQHHGTQKPSTPVVVHHFLD